MIRLRDLEEAERDLDAALAALTEYSQNPDAWAAHERLDQRDRKQLVLHRNHFTRLERLQADVTMASDRLRALQAAFGQA